jgi:hypothetical protein
LETPASFPRVSRRVREEEQRVQAEALGHGPPQDVTVPSEVRFDHGLEAEGRVERYCFAASGWHTGALVIDLAGDEVPSDDLEQNLETAVPREPAFNRGRWMGRGRGWFNRPLPGIHMPPPAGTFPGDDL